MSSPPERGPGSTTGPRASEEAFRLLVEGVQDYAIFMLDPEGHIATWNPGAERAKGYRAEEVLGKHFSIFYPPEAVASGWPEQELRVAAAEGRIEDEGWRVRKDGSRFWANVVITALYDREGRLRGFGKLTRDLTERRRLEQAAVEAAEAERRRLAYELHDDLGQRLAGASVLSYTLEQTLREEGHPCARSAARLGALLHDALDQARALSRALAPVDLLAEGLVEALQRLCQNTEVAYDLTCRVESEGDVRVENPAAAAHLFRIAQEAVNNAARHAEATEVVVALTRSGGGLRLAIRDDGPGLPPSALAGKSGGLGLRTMRSRAAALGGVFVLHSDPGSGTVITCTVPPTVEGPE